MRHKNVCLLLPPKQTKQKQKNKDTLQLLNALVYFLRKLGFSSKCHAIYTLNIHEVIKQSNTLSEMKHQDYSFDTR